MTTDKDDDFQSWFCDLATQYYISGRLAAKCFLVPVYGNLLHHAVEMFLKAVLVGTLSIDEMKNKKYGHDLTALWARFKEKENDTALDRFDQTIKNLHAFDSIRYPDEIIAKRLLSGVGWAPEHATSRGFESKVLRRQVHRLQSNSRGVDVPEPTGGALDVVDRAEGKMSDTDARLWHPWLRINRVLRAMLHERWSAEVWPQVKENARAQEPDPARGMVQLSRD